MAMGRVARDLAAAIVGLALASPGAASAQQLLATSTRPVHLVSSVVPPANSLGSINGVVSDERGGPLGGVLVTVVGTRNSHDTTSSDGRFALGDLPMGRYTLRAVRAGFAVSRPQEVMVGSTVP